VSTFPATATLVINGSSFAAGNYSLAVAGTAGSNTQSLSVPFNVGDYSISGTPSLSATPSSQAVAHLTLTSLHFYVGKINATCDASALSGAQCVLSPVSPIAISSGGTVNLTASINIPNNAGEGTYNIKITTADTTGAPTHSDTIPLTVGQDFQLTSTTSSQTVNPGQTTGPYNLTILPVGSSFNAAVTLACAGLPFGVQCLFNPSAPVTPGNSAQTVVMTISTTGSTVAALRRPGRFVRYAVWFLFPGGLLIYCKMNRSSPRKTVRISALGILLLTLILAACSGVSSGAGGGGGGQSTPAGSYTITVTGSSQNPAESHSANVILVVN
jgi:hypothetical protein